MKINKSGRGFEFIDFVDRYGTKCSLQQSSLADYEKPGYSAIWLGDNESRMHIDRKQLEELLPHLQAWLDNGSFEVEVPNETQ